MHPQAGLRDTDGQHIYQVTTGRGHGAISYLCFIDCLVMSTPSATVARQCHHDVYITRTIGPLPDHEIELSLRVNKLNVPVHSAGVRVYQCRCRYYVQLGLRARYISARSCHVPRLSRSYLRDPHVSDGPLIRPSDDCTHRTVRRHPVPVR